MTEEKKPGATATYVVQRAIEVTEGMETPITDAWEDVATVEVPAKSKRATVIQMGLAKAGIVVKPGDDPLRLRALDARSAHVSTVSAVQAAPKVVVS